MNNIESIFDDESFTPRKGWLINMMPATRSFDVETGGTYHQEERSCLDMVFLTETGKRFTSYVLHEPYFYLIPRPNTIKDCKTALEKKFENNLLKCIPIELKNLEIPNHLSLKRKSGENCLKMVFRTVQDLLQVRKVLQPLIQKNQSGSKAIEAYSTGSTNTAIGVSTGFFRSRGGGKLLTDGDSFGSITIDDVNRNKMNNQKEGDVLSNLLEIREYDVPYYQRVCIDLNINAGCWFEVTKDLKRGCIITKLDRVEKSEPRVLAFDIECTKQPLKFPDPSFDEIYMISYMVDRIGYLIINRTVVSADISDFEYTPKPEFPGPFQIFNEKDEEASIRRFFDQINEIQPQVFVTYNGDSFDFPFVEARAAKYGISMSQAIGITRVESSVQLFPSNNNKGSNKPSGNSFKQQPKVKKMEKEMVVDQEENGEEGEDDDNDTPSVLGGGEYRGKFAVHIDCLYWVKRDSYLPAGSRSLKAVTKAKLGYDPVEVDPENMVTLAQQNPEHMASYSVSDAVATFYLYDKYIHLFVFSLCTIIPLGAEDVLRKGSGTLCEALLMVEAFNKRIICPNKQIDSAEKFFNGHLLETETYVGGHVECLESGVFREDIPINFELDPKAFEELSEKIDRDLKFAIEIEGGRLVSECVNYDRVKEEILQKLDTLREEPKIFETPSIYHLDVGAMYPNIILTNRLQPCAIVTDSVCAACDFNRPESQCKREMAWEWRGEMYPASKADYNQILTQLEYETVDGKPFRELSKQDRAKQVRSRLKEYCSNTFKRVKDTVVETRKATICQREDPFYVNTVRAFRDRRNLYKAESKKWSKKAKSSGSILEKLECETKVLLFDSLQLAHKCILNSFYGYVMRKGARWHSMEMAAVVTKTGSDLIKQARVLVERVGKPLELDTDGIWCVLPASFPENFSFEFSDNSNYSISYPCVMLNADVHAKFTNSQYQNLNESTLQYDKHSECSIFFEVDGPYRCMVLPASQEEGKLLKKRYAVFNKNGTLAELKGFELKRRGELKIVKFFQAQVFEKFLCGSTLEDCYKAVAEIANFWLDVLYTKGKNLSDEEVIDLISENRSMSRPLSDYGDQKSTSITTAKRLSEFLGAEMVREKGLACQLLIAAEPIGAPTTDRAVPTLIFSAEPRVRDACLRKWLKVSSIHNPDVRDVIDWNYYVDRLGKAIQKIITIPAALQKVQNPVPRIKHPEWLARVVREKFDVLKQQKIDSLFRKRSKADPLEDEIQDEEESTSENEVNDDDDTENKQKIQMEKGMEIIEEKEVEVDKFDGWLASRKQGWKDRRASKKSKLLSFNRFEMENDRSKKSSLLLANSKQKSVSSVAQFATVEQAKMDGDVFQILEIREDSKDPGIMTILAAAGHEDNPVIRSLRIRVPRIFYIDSCDENEEDVSLPSAIISRQRMTPRILPHNRPYSNLYKLVVDEELFRLNSKELSNFLSRPQVEGIYEMQMPLSTRAISELPLFGRLKQNSHQELQRKKRGAIIPFEDVETVSVPSKGYLNQKFSRVYLYQAGVRNRQVFAIFHVDEDGEIDNNFGIPKHASSVHFFFSGGEEFLNVEKLLQEASGSASTADSFVVSTYATPEACWEETFEVLEGHIKNRTKNPVILLVQVAQGKSKLLERFDLDKTPCIEMCPDDFVFPALLWKRVAAKRVIEKYLAHVYWWNLRLKSARFGSIPIAHIGEDNYATIADYLFARSLTSSKMLLWASPSNLPDLGGTEDDVSHLIVVSEFENPTVSQPGAYRSVCIEIDFLHLAMNAILESDRVNEIDFMQTAGGRIGSHHQVESNELFKKSKSLSKQKWSAAHGDVTKAFQLLKNLTQLWYHDFCNESLPIYEREVAEKLLIHLYRWLSSPKSFMRDPALHRFVHSLMSKLFFRLLAEIRNLGGIVVHANFEKIIICCTNKVDLQASKDWLDHVLKTLKDSNLFQHLQFNPVMYWKQFLFMDSFNYGGVQFQQQSGTTTTRPVSNWNCIKYLPEGEIQKFVGLIVGEFMFKPSKKNGFHLDDIIEGKEEESESLKFLQNLVSTEFTQRVLRKIPDVIFDQNNGKANFPILPGSYLQHLHNPALEMVKTICAILNLDSLVREQVCLLKRQSLKSLKIMEFSPEAQFKNPSLSLVLPDVICSSCNHCEDIDLCRDERIFRSQKKQEREEDDDDDAEEEEPQGNTEWKCLFCQVPYDKTTIEGRLVEIVQQRSLAFQLQDLFCLKCKTIRADNLSEYCSCSGQWIWAQINEVEFSNSLEPFLRVAEDNQFYWLEEVVNWTLNGPVVSIEEEGLNLAQYDFGKIE